MDGRKDGSHMNNVIDIFILFLLVFAVIGLSMALGYAAGRQRELRSLEMEHILSIKQAAEIMQDCNAATHDLIRQIVEGA